MSLFNTVACLSTAVSDSDSNRDRLYGKEEGNNVAEAQERPKKNDREGEMKEKE